MKLPSTKEPQANATKCEAAQRTCDWGDPSRSIEESWGIGSGVYQFPVGQTWLPGPREGGKTRGVLTVVADPSTVRFVYEVGSTPSDEDDGSIEPAVEGEKVLETERQLHRGIFSDRASLKNESTQADAPVFQVSSASTVSALTLS